MKKILKRIKRNSLVTGVLIVSMYSKVRAEVLPEREILKGLGNTPATYAPPRPSKLSILGGMLKIIIIPLAILIGLVIYYRKRKNDKYKNFLKILIGIISIIIVVLLIGYIRIYA